MAVSVSTVRTARLAISCDDCGRDAGVVARGWRAYHVPELDLAKPPALAWFCPDCMEVFQDAVAALRARAQAAAAVTGR